MTRFLGFVIPLVLALASCSKHPLDGGWREDGAKAPRVLQFHPESNELMVHTPPREDGGHDHLHGTYSLDGSAISVKWQEGSVALNLTGVVEGDRMELSGAAEKLVFLRGASAH